MSWDPLLVRTGRGGAYRCFGVIQPDTPRETLLRDLSQLRDDELIDLVPHSPISLSHPRRIPIKHDPLTMTRAVMYEPPSERDTSWRRQTPVVLTSKDFGYTGAQGKNWSRWCKRYSTKREGEQGNSVGSMPQS